jgi:ADP-ribose pyrophosphatase YjhB (NUDIX family)
MALGDLKYCTVDANLLVLKNIDGKDRHYCSQCKRLTFLNPKLVSIGLLVHCEKLLLVQRGLEPGKGKWAIPGGYVDQGEIVEDALIREIFEETGLKAKVLGLIGVYSQVNEAIVVVAYVAKMIGGTINDESNEVQSVDFFRLDDLPPLSFPRDKDIIADWQQWLTKNKN